jgi:hypothetical protein
MIDVMVGYEYFVDRGKRYFERREILRGARPAIEEKFVVARFDKHRRTGLTPARERRTGSQQGYANFVFEERFSRVKILAGHVYSSGKLLQTGCVP